MLDQICASVVTPVMTTGDLHFAGPTLDCNPGGRNNGYASMKTRSVYTGTMDDETADILSDVASVTNVHLRDPRSAYAFSRVLRSSGEVGC